MGIFITIASVILAFLCGVLWTQHRLKKQAKEKGCPFKHACMVYDPLETHKAIKRVLTLLLDNDVPKKEIRAIIKQSL